MNSPRTIVQRIPPLPAEQDDHFYGYGVMGLPFASGHVLAMRKMHSSVGPKYESVWHRSPEGAWTMWSDVPPSQSCPRYWGNDLQRAIQAPIDISWPGPSRMSVKISNGRDLDWDVQLGSTLLTRTLSAVGRTMPSTLWRRRAVLSAMGAMAGPMLGAGRMALQGTASNGQRFRVNPDRVWFVTGGHAVLNGTDLGAFGPLPESVSLGDFIIPQRGVLAVGHVFFESFDQARHLTVTSRASVLPAAERADDGASAGADVGDVIRPRRHGAGRGLVVGVAGWSSGWRWCGDHSAVTSATAARVEDSSTMALSAANAATRAWTARLLTARG